jgi:hypothetical protein
VITGFPARRASLIVPRCSENTMSCFGIPLIAYARMATSGRMSQITAFRIPFISAVWQIAPVIMRPAPTQPTLIGLPAAWRFASFGEIMCAPPA